MIIEIREQAREDLQLGFRFYEGLRTPVLDKLAEREISADEIEAIISHPEFEDLSRSSGLPVAFGHLMDGRLVIVVYRWVDQVTVQPITASEVPE